MKPIYLKAKKLHLNQLLFFLISAAIFALSFAYIAQYYFGFLPCQLCLYERKMFFVIIAICVLTLAFFKSKKSKKIAVFLSLFFLIINALIAVYHVGVEKKIFKLSSGCNSTIPNNLNSINELRKLLIGTPLVSCDAPQMLFLNLSMAFWNVIFCLILAILTAILFKLARKNR